jgi:hypothetical protein
MAEDNDDIAAAVPDRVPPKLQPRSTERVTVMLKAHHVGIGLPTTSKDLSFDDPCAQDGQQVWDRRFPVGNEWKPLADGSWVENPGVIVVQNLTAPPRHVQPTEEQKAAADAAVLQVASGTDGRGMLTVHRGRFVLIDVANLSEWLIRCAEGEALAGVTVYPR